MFDLILVPLDGSQLAECVLPHITAVARSFDAEVTVLRVLEKSQADESTVMFDLLKWQIYKTKASVYLETMREHFQEAGLRARVAIEEGLEAEGITEFAQNQGVKLIVLSSHGRNGLKQWGVSNVTQKIIQTAQTSLLIVRAHQSRSDENPESVSYPHILIPLDGSQRAEHVLPIITHLARFHQSQIHLAQVVQTPEMARQMPVTSEDMELSERLVARNREEAERYLEEVKSRSYLDGLVVQTHLLTSDNAAVALHQLAEQENIDLVVLSAHGYSGNLQWPYGSMVNNFILYGKVPLLIVQDLPSRQEVNALDGFNRERAEH